MRRFLEVLGAAAIVLSLIPIFVCATRPETTKHHAAYVCWILLFGGAMAWAAVYVAVGAYGGALWWLMNR